MRKASIFGRILRSHMEGSTRVVDAIEVRSVAIEGEVLDIENLGPFSGLRRVLMNEPTGIKADLTDLKDVTPDA